MLINLLINILIIFIYKIVDKKYNMSITEKQQKKSPLSSGKIDKYEYLVGEEILPSDQSRIIEQAKFTYSSLVNAFEEVIKTIEDQGKKRR